MSKIKNFNNFHLLESIEYEKRLNQPVIDILNEQIKNELESSQIYRAISCWLDEKGFKFASAYYFKSANEELEHMNKIYEYLFDKNCSAKVPVVESVKDTYNNIREILEMSLKHEINVSTQWETISTLALGKSDNTTHQFAQWFIVEQRGEEAKFRDLLYIIDENTPKWKIEDIFKEYSKN